MRNLFIDFITNSTQNKNTVFLSPEKTPRMPRSGSPKNVNGCKINKNRCIGLTLNPGICSIYLDLKKNRSQLKLLEGKNEWF